MTIKNLLLATSIAALAVLGGCAPADENASAPEQIQPTTQWSTFRAAFLDEYFQVNPTFAVYQGKHEFDSQLPDWSKPGLNYQIKSRQQAIADA